MSTFLTGFKNEPLKINLVRAVSRDLGDGCGVLTVLYQFV